VPVVGVAIAAVSVTLMVGALVTVTVAEPFGGGGPVGGGGPSSQGTPGHAGFPPGTITTVVGGVGGPGPASRVVAHPCAVSYAGGALYAAETAVVRRIDARTGWLTSPAGDGMLGGWGNGGLATGAQFEDDSQTNASCGVAASVDRDGNLLIADGKLMVAAARTGTFYGQPMIAKHIYTIGGSTPSGQGLSGQGLSGQDVVPDRFGNLVVINTMTGLCKSCADTPGQVQVFAQQTGVFYGTPMRAGHVYTIAGDNQSATAVGNGGPATRAALGELNELQLDSAGNLLIADGGRSDQLGRTIVPPEIRVVAARNGDFYGQQMRAGDVYAIAGGGRSLADGVPAASASLGPLGVARDAAGNVLIGDGDRLRVVAVRDGLFYGQRMKAGDIYTVAGVPGGGPGDSSGGYFGGGYFGGGSAGDSGPARKARIDAGPVAVDGAGNLVFAEANLVRVVAARTGTFYGIAMRARHIYAITSGPRGLGAATTTPLRAEPVGVASDRAGDLSVGFLNGRPEFVPARAGTYFGVAMNAGRVYRIPTARSGLGPCPGQVATDRFGNVLIADQTKSLVLVAPVRSGRFYGRTMTAGRIYRVAGDGKRASSGDGGPALDAGMDPFFVTADRHGDLFVVDAMGDRIRMAVARTGTMFGRTVTGGHVYTVAGGAKHSLSAAAIPASGVPAMRSALYPFGAAIDRSGNLVLATDNRIRVVAERPGNFYGVPMKAGYIYTIAGPFPGSHSVAVDGHGNILMLDAASAVVRLYPVTSGTFYGQRVSPGHTYVIAGRSHGHASLGDGGPATLSWLDDPQQIAIGRGGQLLIVDTSGERIRSVSP
jgi:hypothetical protein